MRLMKIAMLAATVLPLASYAALGGPPVTGASMPLMLRAATPQSAPASASSQPAGGLVSAAPYSVRQSIDANGVTIREYVLSANVVFAVTWDGPVRPNMRALLGSYFANYVASGQRDRKSVV